MDEEPKKIRYKDISWGLKIPIIVGWINGIFLALYIALMMLGMLIE